MTKIIKRYKTCPRHKFWMNGNNRIEKVEHMANDWVFIEWVDLDSNKKDGRIISGYNLFKGYRKATEHEFLTAWENAIPA